MTFISKFTNIIVALSIVLLFAFLLTTVTSNVVTASGNNLLSYSDQDHEQEKERHHDDHHGEDHDEDHGEDHDDHHDEDHDEDDDDDHDHEDGELEEAMIELEMERFETEADMMEMEMLHQVYEITEDIGRTSFFAIMLIDETMEEEQAVELLQECLKVSNSDKAKRAIRLKLVELNAEMDNQKAVRQHMKALILGK